MAAWFLFALASLFFFTAITLIQKHLLNLGITPMTFGLYLMGFSFLAFIIATFIFKQQLTIPSSWIFWLIILGVLSLGGTLTAAYSFQQAPNPSYTQAIIAADAVTVLIGSILIFNSEFTWLKVLGVALTIIGVIIIGIK